MQLTTNQQHVLSALRQANKPLSAYALLDQLRPAGLAAPTQVYRALEKLLAQGLIHRLESLNAYVSCCHTQGCKHSIAAFAICDTCGHIDEFTDSSLNQCLGQWAKHHAFSSRSTTIEIRGQCASCGGYNNPPQAMIAPSH